MGKSPRPLRSRDISGNGYAGGDSLATEQQLSKHCGKQQTIYQFHPRAIIASLSPANWPTSDVCQRLKPGEHSVSTRLVFQVSMVFER